MLIALVFFTSLNFAWAQNPTFDFKKEKSNLNQLISDGMGKDALKSIDKIIDQSIKEKNAVELFYALQHYTDVLGQAMMEKDEKQEILKKFDATASQLESPLSNIMYHFLADQLGANQWTWGLERWNGDVALELNVRGKLVRYSNTDFEGNKQIIQYYYEKSIENGTLLSKIKLNQFFEEAQEENYYLRFPSLYDWLANECITYGWYSERDAATLNNEKNKAAQLFGKTETFAIGTEDPVLKVYEQLELIHWNAKEFDAYTYWRLNRLSYLMARLTTLEKATKEDYFLKSLEEFKQRLNGNPAVLGVIYNEIVLQMGSTGNQYDWKINLAAKNNLENYYNRLVEALKQYPNSIYASDVKSKLESITALSLSVKLDSEYKTGDASLLTLTYKNIDKVFMGVYYIDKENLLNESSVLFKNNRYTKVSEHELALDQNGKYNQHSKDFILPAWKKTGKYLVLIAPTKDSLDILLKLDSLNTRFSYAYSFLSVHDFSVISKSNEGKLELLVMDVKTGNPLSGAKVYVTERTDSYSSASFTLRGTSDKNGMFAITATPSLYWKVVYKNDSVNGYNYIYKRGVGVVEKTEGQILTDRKIYRPGQKVYFKYYAYEGTSPSYKVVSGQQRELILRDMNGTEVEKIKGSTNEFGTFSGMFTLPQTGSLNGNFTISSGDTYASVTMEEYKRPSFEIEAKYAKNQYQLGEKVTAEGKVKAYSGYGIAGARINVIVNVSSFYRYSGFESKVILDTVLYSDANGNFGYSFVANGLSKDYGSNFTSTISVTSVAGETQNTDLSIFIGKKMDQLKVEVPATIVSNQPAYAKVTLVNPDPNVQKTADLVLYKKKVQNANEKQYIKSEFIGFTEKQFAKSFPDGRLVDDASADRNFVKVKEISIQAGDSIEIQKWVNNLAGTYKIEGTIDGTTGEPVKAVFNYIDVKSAKNQHIEKLWVRSLSDNVKPGDEISVLIGSSVKKQKVLIQLYRGNQQLISEWKTLKGRYTLKYKVTAADLGGITVVAMAFNNGTFSNVVENINVPFLAKQLDIQLETKRDFLRPGTKETWIMNVSSKDGSPVSAEMVAAMTDASLDVFRPSDLKFEPYLENSFYNNWSQTRLDYSYFSVTGSWGDTYRYYDGVFVNAVPSFDQRAGSEKVSLRGSRNAEMSKSKDASGETEVDELKADEPDETPVPRTNFDETAFFYPTILAGTDNKYQIAFTLPDALTKWNFQAFAHDKSLRTGYYKNQFTAKKELMIQPNAPRFFRAGDKAVFAATIVNMSEKSAAVTASIEWFDPFTNEVLTDVFGKMQNQAVTIAANGSENVSWNLSIPLNGSELVAYRIKATSGQFADAEERAIPVLSNRVQLIESVPVTIENKGNFTVEMTKLTQSKSTTQRNEKLVLEYNSNPVWSVVMAIPYIMDYPYESADQLFNKYFANQLSKNILTANPEIQTVLQAMAQTNPDVFTSALEKNPELKAIILAETPWVMEAKSESQQKKRIAELFNVNNVRFDEQTTLAKLFAAQNTDGGWSWFQGGNSSPYITQCILSGFGQLKTMGVDVNNDKAIRYLEEYYEKQFKALKKEQKDKFQGLSGMEIQWLYSRSLLGLKPTTVSDYYTECLKKDWTKQTLQLQAMAGTYFNRVAQSEMATKVYKSILNRKTTKPNLGTYWNENQNAYSWDRNAIETQATLIRFFNEMKVDMAIVNEMKLWLMNQKRGQYWQSSKTSAQACYALLTNSKKLAAQSTEPVIKVGNETIPTDKTVLGYLKQTWTASEIQPAMGKVTIQQNADEPAFGSLNLIYTEEIGKISKNTSGMTIDKQIFVVRNGKELPVSTVTDLKLGDLLRIRLQVTADRNLEFVHVKDTRASGTEAVEVLSGYKASGNLYYYSANHDASIDFFIDNLPKGKYHLDYEMRVSGKGVQSAGYAISECMYAPEFKANSNAQTIEVK